MPRPFPPALWQRVNDHFRTSGAFYQYAPRSWRYRRKARLMYRHFPAEADALKQGAYLAKNLVNLQRYPDANKRTTSVLLEVFLEENGYELSCTDEEYAAFLLEVQRRVPSHAWDGRTFALRAAYIPWTDDAYHARLREWLERHTIRKA